jgi:hypothetical protein
MRSIVYDMRETKTTLDDKIWDGYDADDLLNALFRVS